MSNTYDVVIAGGGHNGLTLGAYLARAGLGVAVVEGQEYVGGGVLTKEVTNPGFKHDLHSTGHMFIQANPTLTRDELGLKSSYGLKYHYPRVMSTIVFPDDRAMKFHKDVNKTCESIAEFSSRDAEAYRKFHDWAITSLDMLEAGMFVPQPPFGTMVGMLDSNAQGQELLRTLMISSLDVLDEWFESPQMKIALARFVSEGMVDPQVKGTGMNLILFVGLIHKYGWGVPEGGSGALTDALVRAFQANGGTILTSSPIRRFKIEGGECKGVILESGDEILARKAVVSTLNVKQIADMVDESALPEGWARQAKRLSHSSFSALHQVLALNDAPKYKAGLTLDESAFVQFVSDDYEEFLKVFDGYKFGIPYTNNPLCVCWTIVDPTRAPEGKHTLYLYHYEPYELKDGGADAWDGKKEEVADGVLKFLQSRTMNMGPENILGRWSRPPRDDARVNRAFVRGDYNHIGLGLHQNMGNRPFPSQGAYRMPIKHMYMAGPSTNPGGGVTCGSRAAAPVILEDLGLDFEKIFG